MTDEFLAYIIPIIFVILAFVLFYFYSTDKKSNSQPIENSDNQNNQQNINEPVNNISNDSNTIPSNTDSTIMSLNSSKYKISNNLSNNLSNNRANNRANNLSRPRKKLYRDTVNERYDNERNYFANARNTIQQNDWRNNIDSRLPKYTRTLKNLADTRRGRDDFSDFISTPNGGEILTDADKRMINFKYQNFENFTPPCPVVKDPGWRQFAVASSNNLVFPLCSKPNQLRSELDRFHPHYDFLIINENRLPIYLNVNDFNDDRMKNNQMINIPGYPNQFKVTLNETDPRLFYQSV